MPLKPLDRLPDQRQRTLQGGRVRVVQPHLRAGARQHLANAVAHRPGTDHRTLRQHGATIVARGARRNAKPERRRPAALGARTTASDPDPIRRGVALLLSVVRRVRRNAVHWAAPGRAVTLASARCYTFRDHYRLHVTGAHGVVAGAGGATANETCEIGSGRIDLTGTGSLPCVP